MIRVVPPEGRRRKRLSVEERRRLFEHGRHYGSVRTVDPFLSAAGDVHELPAMYETDL